MPVREITPEEYDKLPPFEPGEVVIGVNTSRPEKNVGPLYSLCALGTRFTSLPGNVVPRPTGVTVVPFSEYQGELLALDAKAIFHKKDTPTILREQSYVFRRFTKECLIGEFQAASMDRFVPSLVWAAKYDESGSGVIDESTVVDLTEGLVDDEGNPIYKELIDGYDRELAACGGILFPSAPGTVAISHPGTDECYPFYSVHQGNCILGRVAAHAPDKYVVLAKHGWGATFDTLEKAVLSVVEWHERVKFARRTVHTQWDAKDYETGERLDPNFPEPKPNKHHTYKCPKCGWMPRHKIEGLGTGLPLVGAIIIDAAMKPECPECKSHLDLVSGTLPEILALGEQKNGTPNPQS